MASETEATSTDAVITPRLWTAGPAGRRRSFIANLAAGEICEYRKLPYQLTLRDIRDRYRQAVMGLRDVLSLLGDSTQSMWD